MVVQRTPIVLSIKLSSSEKERRLHNAQPPDHSLLREEPLKLLANKHHHNHQHTFMVLKAAGVAGVHYKNITVRWGGENWTGIV